MFPRNRNEEEAFEVVESLMNMPKKDLKSLVYKKEDIAIEELVKGLNEMHKGFTKLLKCSEDAVLEMCKDTATAEYVRKELLAIADKKSPKCPDELIQHLKPGNVLDPVTERIKKLEGIMTIAEGYAEIHGLDNKLRKLIDRTERYQKRKQAKNQNGAAATLTAPVATLFQPAPAATSKPEPAPARLARNIP